MVWARRLRKRKKTKVVNCAVKSRIQIWNLKERCENVKVRVNLRRCRKADAAYEELCVQQREAENELVIRATEALQEENDEELEEQEEENEQEQEENDEGLEEQEEENGQEQERILDTEAETVSKSVEQMRDQDIRENMRSVVLSMQVQNMMLREILKQTTERNVDTDQQHQQQLRMELNKLQQQQVQEMVSVESERMMGVKEEVFVESQVGQTSVQGEERKSKGKGKGKGKGKANKENGEEAQEQVNVQQPVEEMEGQMLEKEAVERVVPLGEGTSKGNYGHELQEEVLRPVEQVFGPHLHTPSVEDMQEKMLVKEAVQQVGVFGEGTSKENDSHEFQEEVSRPVEEVPWEHPFTTLQNLLRSVMVPGGSNQQQEQSVSNATNQQQEQQAMNASNQQQEQQVGELVQEEEVGVGMQSSLPMSVPEGVDKTNGRENVGSTICSTDLYYPYNARRLSGNVVPNLENSNEVKWRLFLEKLVEAGDIIGHDVEVTEEEEIVDKLFECRICKSVRMKEENDMLAHVRSHGRIIYIGQYYQMIDQYHTLRRIKFTARE